MKPKFFTVFDTQQKGKDEKRWIINIYWAWYIYEDKERYKPVTMPISSLYMTFDFVIHCCSYTIFLFAFAFETKEMELECIQFSHISWIETKRIGIGFSIFNHPLLSYAYNVCGQFAPKMLASKPICSQIYFKFVSDNQLSWCFSHRW